MARQKLLFICSANISRSRTAEDLFACSCDYEVQSAGFRMQEGSGQPVTQELINWADKVIMMDERYDKHLTRLAENFDIYGKELIVLGIPDIYGRGDPALVGLLMKKLEVHGIVIKCKPG